jgi:hypothetical protein
MMVTLESTSKLIIFDRSYLVPNNADDNEQCCITFRPTERPSRVTAWLCSKYVPKLVYSFVLRLSESRLPRICQTKQEKERARFSLFFNGRTIYFHLSASGEVVMSSRPILC